MKSWWQKPRIRTDEDEGRERKTSWLELFYDLVFAVIVSQLAYILAGNVTLDGVAGYALLFVPSWWLWIGGTYYTDRFETDDISHRLITFLQIIPVVGLAGFAHAALGKTSIPFALSYSLGRIIILFVWLRGGWHNREFFPVAVRFAAGFTLSASLWIGSIFVPAPYRFVLWALGLLIDLVTPLFTLKQQAKLPSLSSSHLPERFGLFTLIVLGEGIVGVVNGMAVLPEITASEIVTAIFGVALAFSLWWIYFDFVGRRLAKPNVPWKSSQGYLHLPLLMSITAIGAGIQSILKSEVDGLTVNERWLISLAVGTSLIFIGVIEKSLPKEDKDPGNHFLSVPLKIVLGILAPLTVGWNTSFGTYTILGALLCFLFVPIIYGTVRWFNSDAPHEAKESHIGKDERAQVNT